MNSVWKFPFDVADRVEIEMPAGAQFLSVQIQDGQTCLWALIETDARPVKRRLLIRGTGHDATGVGRFVGTFQMYAGALVFHAFEDPTDFAGRAALSTPPKENDR